MSERRRLGRSIGCDDAVPVSPSRREEYARRLLDAVGPSQDLQYTMTGDMLLLAAFDKHDGTVEVWDCTVRRMWIVPDSEQSPAEGET